MNAAQPAPGDKHQALDSARMMARPREVDRRSRSSSTAGRFSNLLDGGDLGGLTPAEFPPSGHLLGQPHESRCIHGRTALDLVFGDQVGEHGDDDLIRDEFYAALDTAGLGRLREGDEPIVFHDLRHTFGTMCATAGIDLRRIQVWMGHSDIQTTMRYLHYVPQHDAAARLSAAFSGESVHPTGIELPISGCN